MHLTKPFLAAILLITAFSFALPKKEKLQTYVSSFENVLGTSFDLKVNALDAKQADKAEEVALAEIDRLSSILSSYDPKSEFSQWQATLGQPVKVSSELFEVLSLFSTWKQRTHGALNPAVGQIIKTWKEGEKTNQLPNVIELKKSVSDIQPEQWILNASEQTATRTGKASLVMNSFVKSYIINKVADKITHVEGIESVMVNIGGDIVVKGKAPEKINIEDPSTAADNTLDRNYISINNSAIATSGNYKRGFSINGKWYSHILDPRTGLPAEKVKSVTVVGPNATDAGALATAFNIMDPAESIQLAEVIGAEFKMVLTNGQAIESKGWKNLIANNETKSHPKIIETKAKDKEWDKNFEVAIQLELAKFEGRFRRPFVAVWVEDAKRNTVRTLALWYNKPRWLPDLKEWYRKNNSSYNGGAEDMSSISSATRPAGSYILKWDGKDDKGKYVNEGTYTIFIEAAREHGTYQIMKQEINCKKKPEHFDIPGNIEVSSASVEYKKLN
jgi:thiamine biosynthesis lipoprotein ApbE